MAQNPFSVSPEEMKRLRQTYQGRTTKPTDMRTFKVDARPRAKPQPKLEVAPRPSEGSTAQSMLGMLKGAPEGLADLAVSIPTAAYDYIRTSTPGEVASDIKSGVGRFADYFSSNPLEALIEMSPAGGAKDTGEMLREAAFARDAGDEERAAQIEKFVVPMMLASLVPGGRAIKGAERMAVREGVEAATRAPSLLSAIRANGKVYTGATHLDALESIPDLAVRKAASLDANNRGFVNERGKFMNREKAADYARNFDLFSPDAPAWAKTAPEVISENLKLPEDFSVKKTPEGIIAYHGSPHSFDRFDISKIGTGEGAQAYGHGLYFAEAEPVAQSYRDALQQFIPTIDGVPTPEPVFERARKVSPNVDDYLGILQRKLERNQEALQSPEEIERMLAEIEQGGLQRDIAALAPHAGKTFGAAPSGSMYQVRLNVRPEDLLDWDRRLSDQSDIVKDVVHSAVSNQMPWLTKENIPNATGEGLYSMLGFKSPQHTSDFWQKSGIPGIRYLDQSSRSAGDGTSNYVMFGDDLIDLLRKYAMGGSV